MHLQSLVLAMGGAGLGTCRAAAAIKKDQQLILVWLSSKEYDLVTGQAAPVQHTNSYGAQATFTAPTYDALISSLKTALRNRQLGSAHMLLAYMGGEVDSGRIDSNKVESCLQELIKAAASTGDVPITTLLLHHLPTSASPDVYREALHDAVRAGDADIVQAFLQHTHASPSRARLIRGCIVRAALKDQHVVMRLVLDHATREDKLMLLAFDIPLPQLVQALQDDLGVQGICTVVEDALPLENWIERLLVDSYVRFVQDLSSWRFDTAAEAAGASDAR
jgi:hypothetical protein